MIRSGAAFAMISWLATCPLASAQLCGTFSRPMAWSELVSSADFVVKARLLDGDVANGDREFARFRIERLVKGDRSNVEVGQIVKAGTSNDAAGDVVLLFGDWATDDDDKPLLNPDGTRELEWDATTVSREAYDYIVGSPAASRSSLKSVPGEQLLAYAIPFLQHEDKLIADDVLLEFERAAFPDRQKVRDKLPAEKLRRWIRDDAITSRARGVYAKLLGNCGDRSDCDFLFRALTDAAADYSLALEGQMAAYLRLTDDAGFARLVRGLLRPRADTGRVAKPTRFATKFTLLTAMDGIRQHPPVVADRVSDSALRDASYLLLEDPALADLVIVRMIAWKDWSQIRNLHNKLVPEDLADKPEHQTVNLAIVRYIQAAAAATTKDAQPTRENAQAAWFLERTNKSHPKTVKRAKRIDELLMDEE